MIRTLNAERDNLIAVEISGKIKKEDVEKLHPVIDKILDDHKKVDFYFELQDFEGYDLEGLWKDLQVDTAHISDYGKMVLVGEKKWHEWAAKATDFFTDSKVKFFELEDKKDAMDWIGM